MDRLLVSAFVSIPLIGAFAMFALGIVVIYRASRVLNLAHGAMAMGPAYAYYSLSQYVPRFVALPLAVLSGAALGVAVERVFVRRLRAQGPTAQTVGTVAVTGLLIAVVGKVYGTAPITAPTVFPEKAVTIAGASVGYGDLGLLVVGLGVSAGMFAFFRYTEFGLAMRGAAQNRTAAVLMGIDPNRAAAAAWAIGGALAGLAGVLLAAITNLNPYTLSLQVLPAFVAALIGGLESLGGAVVGSVIAGLAFGLVPALNTAPVIGRVMRLTGSPQLVLTGLAMIVMVLRGRRFSGTDSAEGGLVSSRVAGAGTRRGIGPFAVLGFVLLLLWPWLVPFSVLGSSLLAVEFAVVAISLVVLTGWVGQISLAQASFVGIGAFVTAMAARGLGLGFPFNVAVGVVATAAAAAALGTVALRVRGLYLAIATLIFAWMADAFLFGSPWLGVEGGSSTIPDQQIGTPGALPSFDLTNRRTVYLVLVALLVLVVSSLANLRDTRTGRAFAAVRGSEVAAASLGIDVVRYKLAAFALSGALAGLGGGLLMVEQRTVVPGQFVFTYSLQYLAIAVVGGLGSLTGGVAAGVLFAALNEVFFQVDALAGWLEVVSALLLAGVLLLYPGGLAAAMAGSRNVVPWVDRRTGGAVTRVRDALAAAFARLGAVARRGLAELGRVPRALLALVWRSAAAPERDDAGDWYAQARGGAATSGDEMATATGDAEPRPAGGLVLAPAATRELPADRWDRPVLLQAGDVTVRFGGLTAVADASLSVHEGEIVGLIGPNGAGKTTLFNAILGLNEPAAGTVRLYGRDATALPPHLRAGLGVARTFQVLQLFNELTVFDNLLVATHLHNDAGLFSNLAATTRTLEAERAARERVRDVLRLLRLESVADEYARNLPFGVLRMVELGRALVTGARLMMLDEAASGLNDAETDRLVDVVRGVRDLGVSVLLIEHDVRMVTEVSDYVYVLDQGRMLAEGLPEAIKRDPRVIAAYLGGAVESGAEPAAETAAETVGA